MSNFNVAGGLHSTEHLLSLLTQRPRFQNTGQIFYLAVILLSLNCLVCGQYWRDQTHLVLSERF